MVTEAVEVDDALFEVLAAFSTAADTVKTPWLIIGATARIILLERIYGWPQGLGTQDVDFGVQYVKPGKGCMAANDKEPSLVISPDKNLWHCLSACSEGSDVIQ